MEKKKTWTEPKLTALVGRKPEDGIFTMRVLERAYDKLRCTQERASKGRR